MRSRVTQSLEEWTRGLDPVQSRISVFEHIRNIPYSLDVPVKDPATAPEHILVAGKGSCAPKHYLLAEMFRRIGLDTQFVITPFLWNDPDFRYPPELRRLAAVLPTAYHQACRVRINDRWILVDATWDPRLKSAGFPVNETWDGRSTLRCAVKPLTGQPSPLTDETEKRRTPGKLMEILRFHRGFNAWLAEVREKTWHSSEGE